MNRPYCSKSHFPGHFLHLHSIQRRVTRRLVIKLDKCANQRRRAWSGVCKKKDGVAWLTMICEQHATPLDCYGQNQENVRGWLVLGYISAPSRLKDKLGRQLDDARTACRKHTAEVYGRNVSARIIELGVIESVKEFKPQFHLG